VPLGQLRFAGGVHGAVDGGQQQVLPDGQALAAFGEQAVDQVRQADGTGQVPEGGYVAEAGDVDGPGRRGVWAACVAAMMPSREPR